MSEQPQGVRFRLQTPLASWSESGAALRPTDNVPSWSALVGMIGAAFGWRRADGRLSQLATDYAMAVRIERSGERIEDYQTVQSPERSQADRLRASTRADELSVPNVHTTITRREYVADAIYEILVLAVANTPVVTADEIRAAMLRPIFPLYAGRRSCALGRLAAVVVTGELDTLLPDATNWDSRLVTARAPSLVRERRDMRVGANSYALRHECVA